jgi:hypothetical protein
VRITLARTGGVAGIRKETAVDTAKLEERRARALEECVGRCGFFSLPERSGPAGRERDRFDLALTVEEGERSHTVRFAEQDPPPGLEAVLDLLRNA